MKQLTTTVLTLLLFFWLFTVKADEKLAVIDSLQRQIEVQQGQERIKTLIEISEAYRFISFEKTMEAGTDAVSIADREGELELKAATLRSLGTSAFFISDFDLALEYYFEALKAYEQVKNYEGMAAIYNNIGLIERNMGNIDDAIDYFNKSIEYEETAGNKRGVAGTLDNIANLYMRQGLFDQALELYYRTYLIYEELGDAHFMAIQQYHMATVYWQWDDIDRVIDLNTEALKTFIAYDDYNHIGRTYNNLALVYFNELEEFEKAIEYHHHAIDIRQQIGDLNGLAMSQSNLGLVYIKTGEFEKARSLLQSAAQTFRANDNSYGMVLTTFYKGFLEQSMGHHRQSVTHYDEAIALANAFSIHEFYNDLIEGQLKNYAALGDFDQFLVYFEEYEALFDSAASRINQLQINESRLKHRFDEMVRESNEMLYAYRHAEKQLMAYKLSLAALLFVLLVAMIINFGKKYHAKRTNPKPEFAEKTG